MRSAIFFALGLVSSSCLAAPRVSLTGPVEAYTFDAPTRSLRAVIGFPGAASFGPALRVNLEFASVAPLQTYAIGFERGECLLISGLGSSALSTSVLSGVVAQPEGIAWSGDGSVAILYSRSGNWLQTISGLPGAAAAGPRVDGSSPGSGLGGGMLASVAANLHGTEIAAGVTAGAGGETGAVYLSSDGQNFSSLATVAKPIALSFSSDGATLYVLDGGVSQVVAVNVSSHGYQAIPLKGLTNPVAIQAVANSQNNQQLYIVSSWADASVLRILDVPSQQIVTDVSLSFQATGLDQFGSNSFIVAARAQAANPLWLFTSSPLPGAYFVPAVQLHYPDRRPVAIVGGAR
jgi:hypothetical protein